MYSSPFPICWRGSLAPPYLPGRTQIRKVARQTARQSPANRGSELRIPLFFDFSVFYGGPKKWSFLGSLFFASCATFGPSIIALDRPLRDFPWIWAPKWEPFWLPKWVPGRLRCQLRFENGENAKTTIFVTSKASYRLPIYLYFPLKILPKLVPKRDPKRDQF